MPDIKQSFARVIQMDKQTVHRIARGAGRNSHAARIALILDKAYNRRATKDDEGQWITVNGAHVKIDEHGNATKGPAGLKQEINSGGPQKSQSSGQGSHTPASTTTHKPVTPAKSTKTPSKDFVPALDKAKASCPPQHAWRVDSTRNAQAFDRDGTTTYTTPGGSTFAIKPNGDIISVCKNHNGTDRGKEIMAAAVQAGGTHLDSFDGNYEFYTACGFEVVSRCKFNKKFAPPGWTEGRDKPEDIVFMRYVGVGKTRDASIEDMRTRVPYSADYDEAAAQLEAAVNGGETS